MHARVQVSSEDIEYARIPEVMRMFGISRSGLYLLLGEKKIRAIKLGTALLIEVKSVRQYLDSCPTVSPKALTMPRSMP